MATFDEKIKLDLEIDPTAIEKAAAQLVKSQKNKKSDMKKIQDKALKEKMEAEKKAIEEQHNNGLISEEEYYKKLEEYRDKYLQKGTKEYIEISSKMIKAERESALETIEYRYKMGTLTEEEYYQELAAYRDKYLKEGSKEYLEFSAKMEKARRDSDLEMLEYRYNMGIITEEEYYRELENFRDRYFAEGSSEWLKYTQKIRDYHIEQIQSAYDQIADYAKDQLDGVLKKQETLYKNLDGYRDLVHTVKIKNYYKDGGTLVIKELADISRENKFLKQYDEAITKAANRIRESGVSEKAASKLYDELVSLSPEESLELADLLVRATDSQFETYMKQYEENVQLLDTVSKNPFKEEWQSAADRVEGFIQDSFDGLALEVPEVFSKIGEDAAENFDRSFAESLYTLLDTASTDENVNKLLNEAATGAGKEAAGELVEALQEEGFVVSDAFGELGADSASAFTEQFITELEGQMENMKYEIVGWTVTVTANADKSNFGATTVYSPVYNLYGSGETDVERIQSAKVHAMRDHMAGGY